MVRFWCYACNAEHDNGRDCPHYVDMSGRGSKESGNRKYGVKGGGAKCKRGCAKNHPDNLCPKNPQSIMHPRNKRKRDAQTHKESKKQDKEISGKKSGCVVVATVTLGSIIALAYAAAQVVQSL